MRPSRPFLNPGRLREVIRADWLSYARGENPWTKVLWWGLIPLGWLARLVVRIKNMRWDHGLRAVTEPPLPVISVGNLTVGGTNKTPFVHFLAQGLSDVGLKPAILTRGYSRSKKDVTVFCAGQASRDEVGDEALLLSRRLPDVPVAVCPDRGQASFRLKGTGVDLALADDAFQHRRLDRDCDIVLVDSSCPLGNGRLLPAGLLREPVSALERAHLVVLTKCPSDGGERVARLKKKLSPYVPASRIFTSRLGVTRWVRWHNGEMEPCAKPTRPLLAFSAVGSPESFSVTLNEQGVSLSGEVSYRDHHRYAPADLTYLERLAWELGAEALVCTEKDLYNLPEHCAVTLPLYVPLVGIELDDEERFWRLLAQQLRPRLVVASNGYGEDAVGALVVRRLQQAYPDADVAGFSLVGTGDPYRKAGVALYSSPAVTPSGGLIKYSLKNLWVDLKSGLLTHIAQQQAIWRLLRCRMRTVVCVGDVYLALSVLWGTGRKPLLAATAKTVHITGHNRLECYLLRRSVRYTWARDEASADQLKSRGVPAGFAGNPVMDLACEDSRSRPQWGEGVRLLTLPGSRPRTYDDVKLAWEVCRTLSRQRSVSHMFLLAPTIDRQRLAEAVGGRQEGNVLTDGELTVGLYDGSVAQAAMGADLVLGWGGTGNQVCAGVGRAVVAPDEKGKRVQKKLLGNGEVLVSPTVSALSAACLDLMDNRQKRQTMGSIGASRMGGPGWIEALIEMTDEQLGWSKRCDLARQVMLKAEGGSFYDA